MNACRCPTCSSTPLPTYTEAFRAACEARSVAAMQTHEQRTDYLEDVAKRRGADHAKRLRRMAHAIMKEQTT